MACTQPILYLPARLGEHGCGSRLHIAVMLRLCIFMFPRNSGEKNNWSNGAIPDPPLGPTRLYFATSCATYVLHCTVRSQVISCDVHVQYKWYHVQVPCPYNMVTVVFNFLACANFLPAFGAIVCKRSHLREMAGLISPVQAAVLIPSLAKIASMLGSPLTLDSPYTPISTMPLTSSSYASKPGTPICPQFGYRSEESSGFSSELLSKKKIHTHNMRLKSTCMIVSWILSGIVSWILSGVSHSFPHMHV